jgi:hypothetical protein
MPDKALERVVKGLQEAAEITAAVQRRHAGLMRDHAEWLVAHDKAIAEMRERGKATDARIDRLVIAIGELIRKRE